MYESRQEPDRGYQIILGQQELPYIRLGFISLPAGAKERKNTVQYIHTIKDTYGRKKKDRVRKQI